MKYGYESADSQQIIKNYDIIDNKIIINFLDGASHEIPFIEENEISLLNQLLKQAYERKEVRGLNEVKLELIINLLKGLTNLSASGLCLSGVIYSDSISQKFLWGAITTINLLCCGGYGKKYKSSNDELKELKKYDIYLSIREKLETLDNSNIFNWVNKMGQPLNINTLDDYSLNDIKKIRDNLKRIEIVSSYLNETSDNKVLIKKISK